MDKEFKGVYPALITPMDSDGKLNESALRKVIEFNINAGVHGFWVAGGTGESVLLDDEENRRHIKREDTQTEKWLRGRRSQISNILTNFMLMDDINIRPNETEKDSENIKKEIMELLAC